MTQYYCEFDAHTNGMLGLEPCGAPANVKIEGRWFCEDHADSVEAFNELTEALRETERHKENQ
jgi:hypothetical protein